jgi:hypothetical protein
MTDVIDDRFARLVFDSCNENYAIIEAPFHLP